MPERKIDLVRRYLLKYGYLKNYASSTTENYNRKKALEYVSSGNADLDTERAVRKFQKVHGLSVTGKIDRVTMEQIEKPRCGFPDVTRHGLFAFSNNQIKWNKRKLKYAFREYMPERFSHGEIREAIRLASEFWEREVTNLKYRQVSMDDDPDFEIRFVRGNHFDGMSFEDQPGGDYAHAFPPDPSNPNIGRRAGDIHFDKNEIWTIRNEGFPNEIDLVSVAIHEFGHSLGLGHSGNKEAIMFADYQGVRRYLYQEDKNRIKALYPSSFAKEPKL